MMASNWSLLLNVLLLIGVVVAIARLMQARRQSLTPAQFQPSITAAQQATPDDIIAVRRIVPEFNMHADLAMTNEPAPRLVANPTESRYEHSVGLSPEPRPQVQPEAEVKSARPTHSTVPIPVAPSIMMFLLAKENRQLAGYELLQTVLAAGLRFGEGQIFHRHQFTNGQGPVMCSLAAATESGVFDLQNIGAFSVRGLCLFMQSSQNPSIDGERFRMMLDTAKQLSEGLDTYLLDDKRKPLTQESVIRYQHILRLDECVEESQLA